MVLVAETLDSVNRNPLAYLGRPKRHPTAVRRGPPQKPCTPNPSMPPVRKNSDTTPTA